MDELLVEPLHDQVTSVLIINFTAEIMDKRRDAGITSDSWSVHYTFGSRRGSQFQIFRIRRRQTTRFQYPSASPNNGTENFHQQDTSNLLFQEILVSVGGCKTLESPDSMDRLGLETFKARDRNLY